VKNPARALAKQEGLLRHRRAKMANPVGLDSGFSEKKKVGGWKRNDVSMER
jgi:hypothetical protein